MQMGLVQTGRGQLGAEEGDARSIGVFQLKHPGKPACGLKQRNADAALDPAAFRRPEGIEFLEDGFASLAPTSLPRSGMARPVARQAASCLNRLTSAPVDFCIGRTPSRRNATWFHHAINFREQTPEKTFLRLRCGFR